ncbi:hypothetical protein NEOLEDRAFT_1138122 [Neolentinus lepideus HHB14362 ss-1]|uniref:Uncharacterized protein n=1 Tax=Neolentinus lepideus HHB14362 ss-1 TaxID=1314782 RepID=A0A165QH38_9AGAM|nr:hypothetical protein NEOLEDRAFT_1138122 [Neolentinus lepideus HHB14362 ss-1]
MKAFFYVAALIFGALGAASVPLEARGLAKCYALCGPPRIACAPCVCVDAGEQCPSTTA